MQMSSELTPIFHWEEESIFQFKFDGIVSLPKWFIADPFYRPQSSKIITERVPWTVFGR
jgi:hypothetical protein